MTNQEYHADRTHVSKSWLDALRKNPAKLQEYLRNGNEQTPAMAFGSLLHTFILEPSEYQKQYVVSPSFDKRTKDGKAAFELFKKQNEGKLVVKGEDVEICEGMRKSCLEHKEASRLLLESGEIEKSVFAELLGVKVKCRFDKLIGGKIAVDLKSTEDASPLGFAASCVKFRYMVQTAFYADIMESLGTPIERFLFVAVEKSAPYCVAVYELDEDSVNVGRQAYKEQLALYKSCLELDSWPAYGQEIEKLRLPKWAFNQVTN